MMCGAAASEKGNGLSRLGLEKTVSGSMGPYAMLAEWAEPHMPSLQ
jgi:hypothetical protein